MLRKTLWPWRKCSDIDIEKAGFRLTQKRGFCLI